MKEFLMKINMENKNQSLIEIIDNILRKIENPPPNSDTISLRPSEILSFKDKHAGYEEMYSFFENLKKKEVFKDFQSTGALYKTFYIKIPEINKEKLLEERKRLLKEGGRKESYIEGKTLQSIHLITESIVIEKCKTIFLVLDERFEMPIRCAVWNKRTGELTYIAKLYNIAYVANVPGKMVEYDKRLADNINNGLFRKRRVADYMKRNKLKKPTLVKKSETGNYLVQSGEVPIKIGIIKNVVPPQHLSLYIDKTK
jgi:hypothetical protein